MGDTLIGDGDDLKDDLARGKDLNSFRREEDAGLGAGWGMG